MENFLLHRKVITSKKKREFKRKVFLFICSFSELLLDYFSTIISTTIEIASKMLRGGESALN
jgi:hypothetical protein